MNLRAEITKPAEAGCVTRAAGLIRLGSISPTIDRRAAQAVSSYDADKEENMIASHVLRSPAWTALACAALLLAACGGQAPPAATAPTPASGRLTFGSVECGKLVAIEEVEAALGHTVGLINIVEENVCDYEDESGLVLLTVSLAREPAEIFVCAASDGTSPGQAVEEVAGVVDQAVWSEAAASLCFVKGDARVQLSLGAPLADGVDAESVMADLAGKAANRLP
jgi:hypothetical protein